MPILPLFLRVSSQRNTQPEKKNSKYVATCLLVVVFLLIGLSLWTSSAQEIATLQQGAQVTELYTLLGAQKNFSAVSSAAVAEQEIEIAFDKIDFDKTATLRLPLPNSKAYDAARRDLEGFVRFSPDEFTWRGKIAGVDGSSGDVVLSVKGRALSGLIYSPEGVYEIIPQKDFKHLLVLVNQDLFASCGGAIPPGAPHNRSEELMPAEPANDDGTQIDVLVVYTTVVLNSLGGTSQTQAFIQQAVAAANTAYQNSNISPRLRLVQTLQVDYSENGTTEDALNWVTANSAVAAARNNSKADLVGMLIEESSSSDCGVAWVMRSVGAGFSERGFSVTKRSCAVGNLTFAHELGHNEGSEHNPENGASPSDASFPYAFGHYVDGSFRTVMSTSPPCPSGCPRQPYFSNPSVSLNGFPTGIANQRDNHRVVNNTALIISQFRDSGGTSCTYSLDPTSRTFSATAGSGSFNVSTGSACSWTAVVNAPSSDETLPFTSLRSSRQQDNIDGPSIKVAETASDVFLNSTFVTINDRTSDANPPGLGSLYPSTINVSGMTGTITVVQAALNGITHTFPDDVDVLLVGPGGQRVMLMSDVGGNVDISGVDLTFEQSASSQLPDSTQVISGIFRPTNFTGNTTLEPGGVDNLPSPGPGQSTYSSNLSVFNGTSPNGAWKLYVVDDEHVDGGHIANGWALGLITSGGQTAWINVTSGSSGTGNGTVNYSVASNTSANQRTGTITVNGQVHTVTQVGTDGACPSIPINMGQTLNGSLTSSDCIVSGTGRFYDVYSFSGVAGQGISVSMDSSGFDTYLYLANSANQILDEDDNSGAGTNSRIPNSSGFFTLPANGTYFLWASSAVNNTTGSYSVSLSQCTYSISSSANTVSPGTGSTTFFMDTGSGCSWSAVSDSPLWLTTSSSGSGDGSVRYDYISNNSTSTRVGHITVGGQVHTVTQIGIGGAGNVRFSSSSYAVNEGGGTATITVTRSSGTGSGNVSYATSGGTATPDVDYVPASGLLLFPENVTSRTFDVTILDDSAFEGNESINLMLSNPSTSLTLGSPSSATLTISDNDTSPTRTLTVASSNPSSGISIGVSPADNTGQGNGVTQFTRTYTNGASVTLTAPSTSGSNKFLEWQRDGVDWSSSAMASVTMDADHTLAAVYGPSTPTNFALPVNGGSAIASSTITSQFPASGANNGDRRGTNWGNGGGWADANAGVFPDWLEINFNGNKSISEIDVFTLQDNFNNPVEPTLGTTFATYGLTSFEVQYWNGSSWITVPGGSITGNNKVWRQIIFSPIVTSRIRVLTHAALDNGFSRLTEVEAWSEPVAVPTQINFALPVNGGSAIASSTITSQFPATGANNGDRRGTNWGNGGGWADATTGVFPDWLEINFNGNKSITEIDVFTLQDNFNNPVEPTLGTTFGTYGLTSFEVQYWSGSNWITVPGGSITGNNKVWRQIIFSPIVTSRIRVLTHAALDNGFSRLTEVEAWGEPVAGPTNFALPVNGGSAIASSTITSQFPASGANNGDRRGTNWGNGGGWADANAGVFPDWLEINFNGNKSITEIDVFTLQDNFNSPVEPTQATTFGTYGLTSFEVQYWNGSSWIIVPGGSITGNNKVWRQIIFSPIVTSRIRVLTHAALDNGFSRLTEVEAWGPPGP